MYDWNLELAHVNWDSDNKAESIEESLALGRQQIDSWNSEGKSYVVCMLVDDKGASIRDRERWIAEKRAEFTPLFELLDFICFESSLINLKDEFLRLVDHRTRDKVDREIERYRRKHGRVGCSHDIAIWHSLRLGGLTSGQTIVHRSGAAHKSIYARSCFSILEEEDRAAEERAMEILTRCKGFGFRDRIIVDYYA